MRPTTQTWIFLIIAGILYFLANQTQVGWIYVFVAAIMGLIGGTFLYDWGALKGIGVRRMFRPPSSKKEASFFEAQGGESGTELALPTFYEDDAIEVALRFHQNRLKPAFLIGGRETCPFAPQADQSHSFFIPALFKNQPVVLRYETTCDRRGLYTFPDLSLHSVGPFGFFRTRRSLSGSGDLLVYPAYHPLKRLVALERRGFGQRQTTAVGPGGQVIGVREYRSGDLLRHVHWRSTARRNQLVVKEFNDEDQLSLTVVLDLETGSDLGRGKFSTFEIAVRLAASFGYYASHKKLPFYLAGAGGKWNPPPTALSWWATLTYLAKIKNDGQTPLEQVLNDLPGLSFVVVLVSNPQASIAKALSVSGRKHAQVVVLFISPPEDLPEPVPALQGPTLKVKKVTPDNWRRVLESL